MSNQICDDGHDPAGRDGAPSPAKPTASEGNVTRAMDKTPLHLGGSHQLTPEQSLSGTLDYARPDSGQSPATKSRPVSKIRF